MGVNAAGLKFLSRILPLEAEGTAGLARRHGRAALRCTARHLTGMALQQGYMLAQIAEEINARYGGRENHVGQQDNTRTAT